MHMGKTTQNRTFRFFRENRRSDAKVRRDRTFLSSVYEELSFRLISLVATIAKTCFSKIISTLLKIFGFFLVKPVKDLLLVVRGD
jgi:hypothetical protein